MERRHGDVARGDCLEVGARFALITQFVVVDVVATTIPLGLLMLDLVAVDAFPEQRELDAGKFVPRPVGAIDVQQRLGRKAVTQHDLQQAPGETGRDREIVSRVVPLRGKRDRRDVEHDAFKSSRHRSRIGDVVAKVLAQVDAGDDEIGLTVEEAEGGHADAVHRGAVGTVGDAAVGQLHLLNPEGQAHCYAPRGS